jgi:hypothetical protein
MNNQYDLPEPLADPINVAATRMGVSRATLYNQIAAGLLTVRKAGRRTLVTRDEQYRWLAALPTKSPTASKGA